jgi:glycosyltransferase involved in cell wall biosynthesis
LPVYNGATTSPACLRSVQRQTLTDWECIAVDDGSADGTAERLAEVADADRRFVVVDTPHRGLVGALNVGLQHCRGEFVARMDADDVMHRARLEAQLEMLRADPSLSAVGCHVRIFPRRNLRDGRRAYETWLNGIASAAIVRRDAFVECPIAHPTLMIRREVLLAFGYRERGWPEDYDLLLRLLASGHGVGVAPRRLLSWRDHPERLSRADAVYGLDRFTACKASFLVDTFLSSSAEYALWGYGDTGKAMRKALAAHGKRPGLIVELHPGRLGKSIHGAAVIHPDQLPAHRRLPILVSVAGEEPRRQNRAWLASMGFVELRDFVCVA